MSIGIGELLGKMITAIKRNKILPGDNYELEQAPNGVRLIFQDTQNVESKVDSETSSGLVPVMLKSRVNYNTYTGDVYSNGLNRGATKENVNIRILIINSAETIVGLNTASAIFPAWEQDWLNGATVTRQLTCQPEIYRGQ